MHKWKSAVSSQQKRREEVGGGGVEGVAKREMRLGEMAQ